MSVVKIPLTRGYVAIVDAADADCVLTYRWFAQPNCRNVYAIRRVRRADGTWTTQSLHKFLTGFPVTDHVNGDGLDNRRSNLREATTGENSRNRRRQSNNASGFKGVAWNKNDRKWRAQVGADAGKRRFLGSYTTAEEAARAYDAAARELYGAYASVNFPQPGERAAWT